MDEKLIAVIEKLGVEGINAFYAYMFFDYASVWALIALVAWGVRTVWAHVKEDFNR